MVVSSTEAVLRQLIEQNLSLFLFENARFYAERLYYEHKSQANLHSLAQVYFREGKTKQAYLILQGENMSAENRYLLAQCCVKLDKLEEGERTLLARATSGQQHLAHSVPGGAAGLYLLGQIARRGHRKKTAMRYFKLSLEADSTNWGAIMQLSDMGEAVDVTKLFGISVPDAVRALQDAESDADGSYPVNEAGLTGRFLPNGSKSTTEDSAVGPPDTDLPSQKPSGSKIADDVVGDHGGGIEAAGGGTGAEANDENVSNQLGPNYHLDRSLLQSDISNNHNNNSRMSESRTSARNNHSHSHSQMSGHFLRTEATGEEFTTMSDRELAESSSGQAFHSPNISMSLGMSSAALHVPFATPGSVPRNDFLEYLQGTDQVSSGGSAIPRGGEPSHQGGLGTSQSTVHGSNYPNNYSVSGVLASGHSGPSSVAMHGWEHRDPNTSSFSDFGSVSAVNHTRALFEMNSPVTPIGVESSRLQPASGIEGSAVTTHSRGLNGGSRALGVSGSRLSYGGGVVGVDTGTLERSASGDDQDHPHNDTGVTPSSAAIAAAATGAISTARGGGGGVTYSGENVARRVSFGADPSSIHMESSPHSANMTANSGDSGYSSGLDERTLPVKMQRVGSGGATTDGSSDGQGLGHDHNRISSTQILSPIPTLSPATTITTGRGGGTLQGRRHGEACVDSRGGPQMEGDGEEPFGDEAKARDGPRRLASLLTIMSAGYQLQCLYRCRESIQLLHKLPRRHFSSAWVQQLLGRAYCECNDYKPSLRAMKEMLRLEPFRLEGTELLSTVLWHLKRDKDLCALAAQLADIDKLSPQCWCVVGNCFSLQREPDAAIKFFQRAIQVDPHFTYAYTLCGHESVHNEDFERATTYFRKALLCDDRHYGAWYGLGSIFYHQERYDLAEYHFRRALSINKSSSVLHCYLGMVLRAQDTPEKVNEALKVLTTACDTYPRNSQLHFQRAHTLIAVEQWEEARSELELVRELAPREPPVYILLGNICQRLGKPTQALGYFNTALSLDPKEGSALRANLENLDPEVDLGESDGEEGRQDGDTSSQRSMMSAQSRLSDEYLSSDMEGDDFGSAMLSPDES